MGHDFIYLASQSPRRRQLLEQLGVHHELLLPQPHEDAEALEAERDGELPADYCERVTRAKLHAARRRLAALKREPAPILCSDTTVALGRRILGKPRDPDEAAAMLGALSGRTHRVLTAVAVGAGPLHFMEVSLSKVRFAELSQHSIKRYVQSDEPRGKAGAYAVQGRMAAWIERIDGSYTGVMGLPLHETTRLLSRARVRLDL
jgi:septum formation protein